MAAAVRPASKKRRPRGRPQQADIRPIESDWTELEQAFFAAAPSEDQPAAAPESFDDLVAEGPPDPLAGLRRALAVLRAAAGRLARWVARRARP